MAGLRISSSSVCPGSSGMTKYGFWCPLILEFADVEDLDDVRVADRLEGGAPL